MKPLEQYLNDHLSGSGAALSLLEILAQSDAQDRAFYLDIQDKIASNRQLLIKLIRAQGFRRGRWQEVVGKGISAAGQLRLRWHGLSAGRLGLVEALEMLGLGIHGQVLLWITLKEMAPLPTPASDWDWDFESLIAGAETMRGQVEARRLLAAKRAFGESPAK